jgi:hypothetical protein
MPPVPTPPPPVFRAYEVRHGTDARLDDLLEGQVFHATRVAFESVAKFHLGNAELRALIPAAGGFERVVARLGHRGQQVVAIDLRLKRGDGLRAKFDNLRLHVVPILRHVLHVTGHVSDPAPPRPPPPPPPSPKSTAAVAEAPPPSSPKSKSSEDVYVDELDTEQEEAFAEARVAAAAGKIVLQRL